mgnify:FL=1
MIKHFIIFITYTIVAISFLTACEHDQKRNDVQNIEFSKGNY